MRILTCAAFKVDFNSVFEESAKTVGTPDHDVLVKGFIDFFIVGVQVFGCFRNRNIDWSLWDWASLIWIFKLFSFFPKFFTLFYVDFY